MNDYINSDSFKHDISQILLTKSLSTHVDTLSLPSIEEYNSKLTPFLSIIPPNLKTLAHILSLFKQIPNIDPNTLTLSIAEGYFQSKNCEIQLEEAENERKVLSNELKSLKQIKNALIEDIKHSDKEIQKGREENENYSKFNKMILNPKKDALNKALANNEQFSPLNSIEKAYYDEIISSFGGLEDIPEVFK